MQNNQKKLFSLGLLSLATALVVVGCTPRASVNSSTRTEASIINESANADTQVEASANIRIGLDEAIANITRLQAQVDVELATASSATQQGWVNTKAELQVLQRTAETKLEALQDASVETWVAVRIGAQTALDALQQGYLDAKVEFGGGAMMDADTEMKMRAETEASLQADVTLLNSQFASLSSSIETAIGTVVGISQQTWNETKIEVQTARQKAEAKLQALKTASADAYMQARAEAQIAIDNYAAVYAEAKAEFSGQVN